MLSDGYEQSSLMKEAPHNIVIKVQMVRLQETLVHILKAVKLSIRKRLHTASVRQFWARYELSLKQVL